MQDIRFYKNSIDPKTFSLLRANLPVSVDLKPRRWIAETIYIPKPVLEGDTIRGFVKHNYKSGKIYGFIESHEVDKDIHFRQESIMPEVFSTLRPGLVVDVTISYTKKGLEALSIDVANPENILPKQV